MDQYLDSKKQEENQKNFGYDRENFHLSLRSMHPQLRLRCFPQPPHETQAQQWHQNREGKFSERDLPCGGTRSKSQDYSEFPTRLPVGVPRKLPEGKWALTDAIIYTVNIVISVSIIKVDLPDQ